ncbi:MAG: DUF2817 domain-containing protein [Pirellulaceae bacterium]
MPTRTDPFAADYFQARERFRQAAEAHNARLETHAIAARGPNDEELTLDAALFGSDSPRQTVVVSSGVHGVEGFFGSAVQVAALQRLESLADLSRDTRLVLLHAVNPYGFAFRRRWNEDNVDVNRNLLREGEVFAGSPPLYGALDPLLNPKSPPGRFDGFLPKAGLALARYGWRGLAETLPVGQYAFPQGLFYGGAEPSESNRILSRRFESWLGGAKDVVHIDFHTGLGKHGDYELYLPHTAGSAEAQWFEKHFDAARVAAVPVGKEGEEPAGYPTRGSFDQWCVARFSDRNYKFACAEFGTYPTIAVVAALRAENRAHHWGAADADYEWTKQRLVEVFSPRSTAWREKVVNKGLEIVEQALVSHADCVS